MQVMLSDHDFRNLLEHLNRPWVGYRNVRKGVKKRICRHMVDLECSTIEQYLMQLAQQPAAMAACEQCLRVTISRFFRDRHLWQTLQARILPGLVKRFLPPIRIWSAGCASGEESYSLAMVWNELAPLPALDLLATDAGKICLERARAGAYTRSSLKDVPDEMRARYFSARRGGRQFVVRTRFLPTIRWQVHDLMGDPPEKAQFHLILLRNNVLTYYRGADLQAAFTRILSVLAPGGCLVTGAHERLPESDATLLKDAHCPWVYWLKSG